MVECGFEMLMVEDEFEEDMDQLGFDYMNLIKGLAGGLQGAGGLVSQQQPGTPAAVDAERMRLQMEKQRAEDSARNTKIAFAIVGGFLGLGLLGALAMRR